MAPGGAKMHETARADLKESFNWALDLAADDPDVLSGDKPLLGPNNWPDDDLPELRSALYAYYLAACDCGRDLMRAFAVSLGAGESFFAPRFDKPIARGSALYYPPQPPQMGTEQFGVGAHTDYGCLTLLWQDEVGGLQVQGRDGDWVTAHPIPDTLVVNVGDLLARWSNDRFVSTPHRVVNASGRERYSMAVFFDPNYDAVVDPRELLGPGDGAPKFDPIVAGEHVRARFDAAFAYRQGKG
jgi:isopenicillin N synthase-like dioxygenase